MPPAYQALSLAAFMTRLPELDADWTRRVGARGRPRPRAALRGERHAHARLRPAGLGARHRARSASAGGARNLITFTSARYSDEPLVVSGPGAGPAVTAAGILNDIIALGAPAAAGAWDD